MGTSNKYNVRLAQYQASRQCLARLSFYDQLIKYSIYVFNISVVKCPKIDVQYMTFSPPTADTHDFNTTIEYTCILGYNHSAGDLVRTCNYTGEWTDTLPACISNVMLFKYTVQYES